MKGEVGGDLVNTSGLKPGRENGGKKFFFLNRSSINKWISNRNFPSHLLSCWWVYTAWFQLTRLWSRSGLQWHSSGSGYNYVPLRQKPQRVGKCTLIWECQLREANTHTAHRIFIYWYVKVTGEQFVRNKDLGHIDISCYTLWKLFPSVLQAGASYLKGPWEKESSLRGNDLCLVVSATGSLRSCPCLIRTASSGAHR